MQPAVMLFAPPGIETSIGNCLRRGDELEAHGFRVQHCTDMPALCRAVHHHANAGNLSAIVLGGAHAQNCIAASQLRALHPALGIVVLVDSHHESSLLHALQSGADCYCPASASPQLVAAVLYRLLWRLDALGARADTARKAVWSLPEQAWILASPDGKRIALTTGERAFLMALLAAPNQRATHTTLIQAVNAAYELESSTFLQSRLSVLVSRLRRKCSEQGLGLPLKSVHNWGYMFTGAV